MGSRHARSGYLEEIPETRRIEGSRRLTSSQRKLIDETNGGTKIVSGGQHLDQSSYINSIMK